MAVLCTRRIAIFYLLCECPCLSQHDIITMKQLVLSLLYFFFLFLSSTPLLAFQQLPPTLKQYGSLEKAVAATEELGYAGDFSGAIEIAEAVKEVYRERRDIEALCFISQEIMLFQVIRTDLDNTQKEAKIKATCARAEAKNDPRIDQICQAALAHLMMYAGDLDRFSKYYEQATKIAQQQNDYKTLRTLNVNIATEYLFASEWQSAKIYLQRAEDALSKETIPPTNTELGSFHNARTVIYYNLSEYDKALTSALFNVYALENSKDDQTISLLFDYNNLAGIYTSLGEEENALIYHKKALELLPNAEGYPIEEEAVLYYNIAIAYSEGENRDLSLYYAKKVLKNDFDTQDPEKVASIAATRIGCYLLLLKLSSATGKLDSCDYYLNSVERLLPLSPIQLTDYYRFKSLFYKNNKSYQNAILYAEKSRKQAIKDYGEKDTRVFDALLMQVTIYKAVGNHIKVLDYVQAALEIISIDFSDKKGYNNPSVNNIVHKESAVNALVAKIEALSNLYKQNQDPKIAQAILATTYLSTQVLEQLNKEFKNPATKRRWLQEQAIPLFESAIASAIEIANSTGNAKYLQDAFELSERSKSMLMTDMLQEQQAAAYGGVPDSLVEQLQSLNRALHVAEKKRFDAISVQEVAAQKEAEDRIFKINQDLDILKRRFEKNYPKYYKLKYDDQLVSLKELQTALEPGSMLLEYFEGDEHIYIFSVYQDRLEVASFERDEAYNRLFKRFSNSLINVRKFVREPVKVYNSFVTDAYQLYQYLLQPVDLKGIERLIIIPDGELSYLPFEVLLPTSVALIEKEEYVIQANFTKLPYLLHVFSTNYNYSGRLWLERNALSKKAVNDRILALAPKYSGVELPDWRGQREVNLRERLIDLPGAAEEVKQLEEHYAGAFYSGYAANEALLKKEAANYGILHLAMHGLVNSKNPEFSGLALAEDKSEQEDNFLYAYEIEQLPIQASLIVLSACETGIGQYQRGEGVVSIGRSFVYAGAPSLLMTLWNLNDQSGAFIVEEFYKNLNNGLEKDEAIRQAKQNYLKTFPQEYAHPFLWAAFVQVGSYESITIASKNSWGLWGYYLLGIVGVFSIILLLYKRSKK